MICGALTNSQQFAMAQSLRKHGLAVDEDAFSCLEVQSLGLTILENIDFPGIAFNLQSGATGYVLNALVSNGSKKPSYITRMGFEGPDFESNMSLLPDPKRENPWQRFNNSGEKRYERNAYAIYRNTRNTYIFPDSWSNRYPREVVLNHQIGRSSVLSPGQSLDGYILAMGKASIPQTYRDFDRIEVPVKIYGIKGYHHKQIFHAMVQRLRYEKQSKKLILERRAALDAITAAGLQCVG